MGDLFKSPLLFQVTMRKLPQGILKIILPFSSFSIKLGELGIKHYSSTKRVLSCLAAFLKKSIIYLHYLKEFETAIKMAPLRH